VTEVSNPTEPTKPKDYGSGAVEVAAGDDDEGQGEEMILGEEI